MEIIDNLKRIFKKENWRLSVLVLWLLVGVIIIQFLPIVGIIIFLPYLTFLMFLFLLSLATRKNIMEYPTWKIVLLLVVSLPLLLLLAIILIVLFAVSIISYFFFTSWFILYACYLTGVGLDKKLHKSSKSRTFIRTIIFFGGIVGSIALLYLFIIGPNLFDFSLISTIEVPLFLNLAYVIVGCVIIGLAIYGIVILFKRVFNAWLGTFFILVAGYSLFLVVKIYLGLDDGGGLNTAQSVWTTIGMLIIDLAIILYSLSTLLGKNAEFLAKRFKRIGIDTAIIWLIFSKVAYEFIRFFPYSIFEAINIPLIQTLSALNNDDINLAKNVAVLGFFIVLLLMIGIYEIRKYTRKQKELKKEVHGEVKEIITPQPLIEEIKSNTEEPQVFIKQSEITEEDVTLLIKEKEEDNDKDID
ncbi:MAG: hypothetical protein ACFE9C_02800 [Candidatus Hodarchaeota archaeon]